MRKHVTRLCLVLLIAIPLVLSIVTMSGAAQKVTLKMWNTAEALANPLTEKYIKDFEQKYPEVKVEFFTYPWQELRSKLLAAYAAGTAPDILQLDTPWLPEFTEAGLLDPAPKAVVNDLNTKFFPVAKHLVSFNKVAYGYPWWVFTNALIYNKALFREAGLDPNKPPKTWAQLEETAKKLTKYDAAKKIVQPGFLINPRLLHFTDYLYNNGGAIVGENTQGIPKKPIKSTFNTPATVKALEFLNRLYNVDRVGSTEFTANMYEAFQKGQVGMLIEAQWLIPWTKSAAPNLEFGIAPIPTPTGKNPQVRADAWIMVVNKRSEKKVKEYAWKFMQQYISTSQGEMLKCALSVPTRRDVSARKDLDWIEKFYVNYLQGVTRCKPFVKQAEEFDRRVEPILLRMYRGELSPKETARLAEMEINAVLAGD
ncbi:MAG: ABC transporter substrate-binding protein [Patescibacteria group bacterium]